MSSRDMRRAAWIVAATVAVLAAVAGTLGLEIAHYPDSRPPGPRRDARVVIEKGTSLGEIARRLSQRGIIDHPSWFRFYASERGLAPKTRAGQYTFSSTMTPKEILQRLVEGAPAEEVTVTLPEGKNMREVAAILEEAGICSAEDLLKQVRDPKLAQRLGVFGPEGTTLEGYLFPETYRFRPGTPAVKVLTQLVKQAEKVLGEVKAKHPEGAAALASRYGFSDRDIVLLASLVEKETGQPGERPRIAGVFLNRLRLPSFVPHLLQTDPSIVYGCTVPQRKSAACLKFDGRIRRLQLEDRDNPYNTYTHEGLPPGPIANPGRASLEAVVAPESTAYLYFVSKNDGSHQFSRTRGEHEAAVDRYQRN